MEPKVSMSLYAAAMTAALLLLAAAGFRDTTLWLIGGLAVYAAALDLLYLAQRSLFRRRTSRDIPRHRLVLDWVVRTQWIGSAAIAVAVTLSFRSLNLHPLQDSSTLARAIIVAVAVALIGVYASSLVDWYWILPKVSGIVCLAPCEAAGRERWSLVTSFWYFHRAVATALVAIAVTGIPFYMLSTKNSGRAQAFWSVAGLGVAGLAGVFYKQTFRAGWYAFNPPIHVGDVIRAEIEVDGEDERRDAYVVDVSLQGAKVKLLEDGRFTGLRFETKGDIAPIPNDELPKVRRRHIAAPFCPDSICSGINWYCRCNVLAHVQKPEKHLADEPIEARNVCSDKTIPAGTGTDAVDRS